MAFDGIVTKAIVSELSNNLIGAKVNKVLEPNKNEIILNLYNNKLNYSLDINIHPENYKISLTTYSKPNPLNALNFCMLLRKYLIGFRIKSISSFDLERCIEIVFEGNNELKDNVSYKLIIELMGRRSNIVFVNQKNQIIDSIKHIITKTREILPAREYVFPEITKKSFLELKNFDEFYSIISNEQYSSISSALTNIFIGFSKTFIQNILQNLDIQDDTKDVNDLQELYNYITKVFSNFGTQNIYCKQLEDNDFCIDLSEIESHQMINFFIDDFYHKKENIDNFNNKKTKLSKLILGSLKKCSKKLENINKKLKDCENMDKYKIYGELLTANLYKLNGSSDKITLENYYDNNTPIEIPLDSSIPYNKNAEKYFKKYNKLKNTLSIVSKQKEEAELELRYIESIVYSVSTAKTLKDISEIHDEFVENVEVKRISNKQIKKSKENEDFRDNIEKLNINNFDVYVGKNNKQNDYLTLHFAKKEDIWFHVQDAHGSHVILKTNGQTPDEDTLYKCAVLAKQNSKANLSKNVSIDYTQIKYVKKHPNKKLGMVHYTDYKTIIV
ncbi:MAG: NFACT family protein [Clostridia bacterium]|nr:NFACT family protein [Clostridia bacterium]